MKVKICGVTNLSDAKLACSLGADFIGFLVEIDFAEDKVTREEARDIIKGLPVNVKPVMVTYEQEAKTIIEIAKVVKPKVIQLHNDIQLEEVQKIRSLMDKSFYESCPLRPTQVYIEEIIERSNKSEDNDSLQADKQGRGPDSVAKGSPGQ